MKKYTEEELDTIYEGNLKLKEIGHKTFYLDKLTTKEYAVNLDEENLGVFQVYMDAVKFYKEKIKEYENSLH